MKAGRDSGRGRAGAAVLAGIFATVFAGALAAATAPAGAQAGPEITWRESRYNPKADEGDLILPVPCGGAIVFRRVDTPHGASALDDRRIFIGDEQSDFSFVRGMRRSFISGGFVDPDTEIRYYYIAKYEVARAHYDAVMSDSCPEGRLRRSAFVAQSEVSWFDALSFTRRYTEWLWANALGRVPTAAGRAAFVRLPTEAEWEYAARGGSLVDAASFRDRLPDFGGRSPSEFVAYGGSDSANGRVQTIGSLEPNLLGMHDMLGNVAEMTIEPFQLNRAGRLHGRSGSFVQKGGSARTPLNELSLGSRDESPYFDPQTGRATVDRFVGFRIVLGAPVITTRETVERLQSDFRAMTEPDPSTAVGLKEDEAVRLLNALAADPDAQAFAGELRSIGRSFEEARVARNEQRDLAVQNQVLAAAYSCTQTQTLVRSFNAQQTILTQAEAELARLRQTNPDDYRRGLPIVEEIRDDLDVTAASIRRAIGVYGEMVQTLATEYSTELFETAHRVKSQEAATRSEATVSDCLRLVEAHVIRTRASGDLDVDQWREDFTR